ncbi:MAG: hypothetical protein EXR99_04390 [Gemmataceae bacterium]|nr:hypothetical protein [Gemmataceae bacterium]
MQSFFITIFGIPMLFLASALLANGPGVKNPYPLVPEAGTWLICCGSYSGPDAAEMSRQVAENLRTRDKVPAYIFNYGEEERKKQIAEWERRQKLTPEIRQPMKFTRVADQCAVLIGGFRDIDDSRKNLEKVKKFQPPVIKLESGKEVSDVITLYVPLPDKKGAEIRRERVNPFQNSFVVRNPLIPQTNLTKKPDPILKSLNAEEKFSLLKNSKQVTLLVKEYSGNSTIQATKSGPSSFLDKLFSSGKQGETLNAAAMQAHETARFLRKLDFDAYVLHTRTNSLVTVGGFDSPTDPNLARIQKAITQLKIQALDLYVNPVPMEIPKF